MIQKFKSFALGASVLSLPLLAHAEGLADLTDSVDFSEVGTAIVAVGALLAGVYVLWKGASMILRAIRGL
jgi:hypothetical protein